MIQMTTSQFSKVFSLLTVSHCSQPTFAEQLQATLQPTMSSSFTCGLSVVINACCILYGGLAAALLASGFVLEWSHITKY